MVPTVSEKIGTAYTTSLILEARTDPNAGRTVIIQKVGINDVLFRILVVRDVEIAKNADESVSVVSIRIKNRTSDPVEVKAKRVDEDGKKTAVYTGTEDTILTD